MERPGSGSRRKTSFAGMPRRAFRLVEEFTDTAADGRYEVRLYASAAEAVGEELDVRLFTDRDIGTAALADALDGADIFFASLVFDYDQVAWLRPRLERVPTRFIFESALELMSETKVAVIFSPADVFLKGNEFKKNASASSHMLRGVERTVYNSVPGPKERDVLFSFHIRIYF